MMTEHEDKTERRQASLHAMQNYAMGILWLALGIFCLFSEKFGVAFHLQPILVTIFGVLFILYGLFRVYRGYKKKY